MNLTEIERAAGVQCDENVPRISCANSGEARSGRSTGGSGSYLWKSKFAARPEQRCGSIHRKRGEK